jgi:class 3 adenylate cyclase
VWDGRAGDGPGGTTSAVERWRELGLDVEMIDSREILRRERPELAGRAEAFPEAAERRESAASSGFVSEIRGLLFADVEGFSKLTEEEIPRFVEHFLGLVGKLAAESGQKALMRNTWGDGVYFVFRNVRDAGQFALELRDAVREADWPKLGLPGLKLRIALHAGPVYSCTDPVTQRTNYVGAHVSRAARIEPITPTGQVYASEAFAALAAAEGVKEFHCEYVGQTSLAKKYGTFRIFVVLGRRN